jgi:hypothetical protein
MVSSKQIEKQLKRIGFNFHAWGRTEVRELEHILLEDEEIFECVNGIYEGGFALLVATDIRVLLIDKKPLNYLSVEDMRYELISEIDYNHRLIGAYASLASGNKNLKFSSLNQQRLRKLITHVQHCMAESKKKQNTHQADQNQHLEQINQQLQMYLVAQHKQQEELHDQMQQVMQHQQAPADLPQPVAPVRPSPELADYLFAQSLLQQHNSAQVPQVPSTPSAPAGPLNQVSATDDLYEEGRKEIFGNGPESGTPAPVPAAHVKRLSARALRNILAAAQTYNPREVNALRIAYSKLPMALRNRKFGRPSFHAHSQEAAQAQAPTKV